MVGQIKFSLGKEVEAKIAFEKFKQIRDLSSDKSGLLTLIAAYFLNRIEPEKYKEYFEAAKQDNREYVPHFN